MPESIWAIVDLNLSFGRLTMHQVPRSLFDLIPGEAKKVAGRDGAFWTKGMTLVGEPGKHLPLTVYCTEPPLQTKDNTAQLQPEEIHHD